jgi:CRISPR type I-E-associated protein CasB/Cse2
MSQTFAESFVTYLQSMKGDRGKLATLRKGLIENQAQATWPLLSRFLDFDSSYQIKALQTIAGLFAHHPKNADSGNFGNLCHQLLDSEEEQKITDGESGPISRHFQYALAATGEEIFPRVRRLVLRAKKDEIPVNYIQLVKDLLGWHSYKKDRIKFAWGKAFWQVNAEKKGENRKVKEV